MRRTRIKIRRCCWGVPSRIINSTHPPDQNKMAAVLGSRFAANMRSDRRPASPPAFPAAGEKRRVTAPGPAECPVS